MRKLNTAVRVTNKYVRDQFEEINRENLRERFSYGIVSDSVPDKEDSPFAVKVLIQRLTLNITDEYSYTHGTDSISFSYTENDIGKRITFKEGNGNEEGIKYWHYGSNSEESLSSLCEAINSVDGLNAYITSAGLLVYGISSEGTIDIVSPNNYLYSNQDIDISVREGTVIFPNRNSVTYKEETVRFPNEYLSKNDVYMLCLKYNVEDNEVVKDEFDEDVVKSTKVSPTITFEDANSVLSDDTVCIAVLKVFNNSVNLTDVEGHNYSYNRPWYSPEDVFHRNNLGTADVTEHNPHGIDFDDIDSDNTLHNRLLNDGIILTPPQYMQDIPGVFMREEITGTSIVPDIDGLYSQYDVEDSSLHPARFYCLKYIPLRIHKIIRKDDGTEIFLKWIQGTSYLLCSTKINEEVVSISDDIIVYYSYSKTAQPTIQKTQGILVNSLTKGDVMLSEGKNVKLFDTNIDIFHMTNINRYYFASIDKEGNIITNPSVLVNNSLATESDNTSNVRERSRLAVFLYNTNCRSRLEAPTTGVNYICSEGVSLYKTNSSYTIKDGSISKNIDSYVSPVENTRDDNTSNEYIILDTSIDYDKEGNRVSKSLHCVKDVINKSDAGRRNNHYELEVNFKKRTALHAKGYIVVTGAHNSVSASLFIGNSEGTRAITQTSYDTQVTLIRIDEDIPEVLRQESGKYTVTIDTDGDFYVQDIYIELSYDEVRCCYFISQEEDSSEEVTRLLYDSTREYAEDIVVIEGKLIKIKKTEAMYNHRPHGYDDKPLPINNLVFPIVSIKSNEDFNVDINVYGDADSNSITENVVFDSSFREQYGFNYAILNNAFTSVSKYTINNTTTDGSILILAYPLSNYLNPAKLLYVNYESERMKDCIDNRICVSTIPNSKDFSSEFLMEASSIL